MTTGSWYLHSVLMGKSSDWLRSPCHKLEVVAEALLVEGVDLGVVPAAACVAISVRAGASGVMEGLRWLGGSGASH